MFEDLDEVLRKLLIEELEIKNGEVAIEFHIPNRDWSQRLSRPTINLFLFDLRENQRLRGTQPVWQMEQRDQASVVQRRKAVRGDLCYMITAWANEPEDEHSLLSRTWLALLRYPRLPVDLLPESLRAQPLPIPLTVGQHEDLRNPADVWNVLDNEMRPALALTVTLCLDPAQELTAPLVRSWELRVGHRLPAPVRELDPAAQPNSFWTIGGSLRSKQSPEELRMTLVERGLDIPVQPDGRFVIGPVPAGDYTLEVRADGGKARQFRVTVPAADCTLEV